MMINRLSPAVTPMATQFGAFYSNKQSALQVDPSPEVIYPADQALWVTGPTRILLKALESWIVLLGENQNPDKIQAVKLWNACRQSAQGLVDTGKEIDLNELAADWS